MPRGGSEAEGRLTSSARGTCTWSEDGQRRVTAVRGEAALQGSGCAPFTLARSGVRGRRGEKQGDGQREEGGLGPLEVASAQDTWVLSVSWGPATCQVLAQWAGALSAVPIMQDVTVASAI